MFTKKNEVTHPCAYSLQRDQRRHDRTSTFNNADSYSISRCCCCGLPTQTVSLVSWRHFISVRAQTTTPIGKAALAERVFQKLFSERRASPAARLTRVAEPTDPKSGPNPQKSAISEVLKSIQNGEILDFPWESWKSAGILLTTVSWRVPSK